MLDPIDFRILDPTLRPQLDKDQEIKLSQIFSGYKILIMYDSDAYSKQL